MAVIKFNPDERGFFKKMLTSKGTLPDRIWYL
jgi:hypothetical protein